MSSSESHRASEISQATWGPAEPFTDEDSGLDRTESFGEERRASGSVFGRPTVQEAGSVIRGTMQDVVMGPTVRHGHNKNSEMYDPTWGVLRICFALISESLPYKLIMAFSILFNMVMLIVETDARATSRTSYYEQHGSQDGFTFKPAEWIVSASKILLVLYVVDLLMRMFVSRAQFFKATANRFDFMIVSTDCLVFLLEPLQDLPSVAVLRVLRMLRIVRVLRSFLVFRELYLMMQGLVSAIRSIIFATFLIAVVLVLWSIMAVEFVHMSNVELADMGLYGDCTDMFCRDAYSSVWLSSLTFLKGIVAGDSWGTLAYPLIILRPGTSFVILGSLLMVQLGLLNLIVAVIVDRAAAARENDEELMYTEKQETLEASYRRLKALFNRMDADGGGSLSLEELQESYETHADFREILDLMDIRDKDLELVFNILDMNGDDEVSYTEFVEQLHEMKTFNSHTLLIYIKHYSETIFNTLKTFTDTAEGRKTRDDDAASSQAEGSKCCDSKSFAQTDVASNATRRDEEKLTTLISEPAGFHKSVTPTQKTPRSSTKGSLSKVQVTNVDEGNFSEAVKEQPALAADEGCHTTNFEQELLAHGEAMAAGIRAGLEKAIDSAVREFVSVAVNSASAAVERAVGSKDFGEIALPSSLRSAALEDLSSHVIQVTASEPSRLRSVEVRSLEEAPHSMLRKCMETDLKGMVGMLTSLDPGLLEEAGQVPLRDKSVDLAHKDDIVTAATRAEENGLAEPFRSKWADDSSFSASFPPEPGSSASARQPAGKNSTSMDQGLGLADPLNIGLRSARGTSYSMQDPGRGPSCPHGDASGRVARTWEVSERSPAIPPLLS